MRTLERTTAGHRPVAHRPTPVAVAALAALAGVAALLDPRIVVACVLVGAAAIAIVERPARGGLLIVALVPITSGFRAGLGLPGLRLGEAVVLGVAVLVLLAEGSLAGRHGSIDALLVLFVTLHLVIGVLHAAWQDLGLQSDVIGGIVGPVQWLLIVRIVTRTLTTPQLRVRAIRLLLALSIPTSVLACAQQLNIGPARTIVSTVTDPSVFGTWMYQHYPRATGPFPSWHTLAGYLMVVLVVGLVALIDGAVGVPRRLVISSLVTSSAALVLSQTFTALFVVGAAAVYLVTRRRRATTAWWLVAVGVAVVSIFGGSLSDRVDQQARERPSDSIVPQTIAYRFEVWTDDYSPLVARYWSIGYGPGLPDSVDWNHTESGFITLLLRGGVPLLAIGITLMVAIYRTGRRGQRVRSGLPRDRVGSEQRARGSSVDRGVCVAVLVLTIGQIPLNLVWPYFTNSGMTQPFWVLVGLMLASDAVAVEGDLADDAVARGPSVAGVEV